MLHRKFAPTKAPDVFNWICFLAPRRCLRFRKSINILEAFKETIQYKHQYRFCWLSIWNHRAELEQKHVYKSSCLKISKKALNRAVNLRKHELMSVILLSTHHVNVLAAEKDINKAGLIMSKEQQTILRSSQLSIRLKLQCNKKRRRHVWTKSLSDTERENSFFLGEGKRKARRKYLLKWQLGICAYNLLSIVYRSPIHDTHMENLLATTSSSSYILGFMKKNAII